MSDGPVKSEKRAELDALRLRWQPLHEKMNTEIWELWAKHRNATDFDPSLFQRLSLVTVLQIAATMAVDSNIDERKFMDAARSCFEGAYNRAPKWG
jgi:hypothetical protein